MQYNFSCFDVELIQRLIFSAALLCMNPSAASSSKNKSMQKKLKEQKRKVGGVMK